MLTPCSSRDPLPVDIFLPASISPMNTITFLKRVWQDDIALKKKLADEKKAMDAMKVKAAGSKGLSEYQAGFSNI